MDLNFTGTDVCAINGTRSAARNPLRCYRHWCWAKRHSGGNQRGTRELRQYCLSTKNPVSGALMGNDVPLYFGGRMTAATQNSERMLEAIFTSMA
jgi:hypothetical protein